MPRVLAVAGKTFLQTVRQPAYGIIVLATLGGMALAPSLTGWTLDDDNKMLRDLGLSTLLVQGLLLACFAACSSLDMEVQDKTVLSVLAKPMGRGTLFFGKYLGVVFAILAAEYLAGGAFLMALRHGVLQTAADKPDMTVIVLGPCLLALVMLGAGLLNYLRDWRFFPTLIGLALPAMTLSVAILLVFDRDWRLASYEVAQSVGELPEAAAGEESLRGIVEFLPDANQVRAKGSSGLLVRKTWLGPITPQEQDYLRSLSDSLNWLREVDFLVVATRNRDGAEILKAGLLIQSACLLLAGFASAAASRLGFLPTLLICLMALGAGLSIDQVLRPEAEAGALWARSLTLAVPNFQFFWMLDALADQQVIPWSYVASAAGYGLLYTLAVLLVGVALFETREVG
jgi:hypothetical protein